MPPLAPRCGVGVTTTLEFGAVNYGAEVAVDGALVGVHYGPNMPFAVDITAAGDGAHNVTVVSRPFAYFGGSVPSTFTYTETWLHPPNGFSSRTPNGISKYARIVQHPAVRVEEVALRTSVANMTLTAEIVIRNDGHAPVNVTVTAAMSSWNGEPWLYAPILPVQVLVPSSSLSVPVTLSAPWISPPESFWWPNRPFNASYVTQLHWFNVSLTLDSCIIAAATQRFGFVEHAEGPFYYTINGVRLNQLSDATPEMGMSYYDAYSSAAVSEAEGVIVNVCDSTWICSPCSLRL